MALSALAAIGVLAASTATAHHVFVASGVHDPDREPPIAFDTDDETVARHHLTESFSVGAGVELDLTAEVDFDLDDAADEDELSLEPILGLAATWEPSRRLRLHGEIELSREFLAVTPEDERPRPEVEVQEAYLALRGPVPALTAVVGRQVVEDERAWLVDRSLDGLRLIQRLGDGAIEAMVAHQELLGDFEEDRATVLYLRGHRGFAEDSRASLYALSRQSVEDSDGDLWFLGGQSVGALAGIDYWLDAAAVLGDAAGREVRGYGVDLGGTYAFEEVALEPSLTLGFAYGSGDDEGADEGADEGGSTSGGFRQSGMQDNTASFGGLADFKYYGETLDPELGNLAILTAGIGIRPSQASSVDLVYHRYWQAEASDVLRDSQLDADPTGASTDIGHGLDLIVGVEAFGDTGVELGFEAVAGVFLPGAAFEEDDPAWQAAVQMRVDF